MPTTRHCLLIVDDEPNVCDSVHDLLRREFRVLKAHSAEEGYRIMQEEEVHIVMSDQRMPQITGVELLTKVKARHPQAIRMLFTGFADLESIIAAINQGHIFRFLKKPWQPEELHGRGPAGRRRVRSARADGAASASSCWSEVSELKDRVSALRDRRCRQLRRIAAGLDRGDGRLAAGRRAERRDRGGVRCGDPTLTRIERDPMGRTQATHPTGRGRRSGRAGEPAPPVPPRLPRPDGSLGAEAIEMLEQNDVHLILSDQRMPGMSGDVFLAPGPAAQARRDPDALHRLRRHPGGHQRGQRRAHLPLHPQALGRRRARGDHPPGGRAVRAAGRAQAADRRAPGGQRPADAGQRGAGPRPASSRRRSSRSPATSSTRRSRWCWA